MKEVVKQDVIHYVMQHPCQLVHLDCHNKFGADDQPHSVIPEPDTHGLYIGVLLDLPLCEYACMERIVG